jgi:hypothetical protein
MDKILKIVSLKEKQSDFAYWSSKTEYERLEALEFLRSQYINYKKDVQSRLQRVCKIVNRKSG